MNIDFIFKDIKIDRDLNSAINIAKRSGKCLTHDEMLTILQSDVSELVI